MAWLTAILALLSLGDIVELQVPEIESLVSAVDDRVKEPAYKNLRKQWERFLAYYDKAVRIPAPPGSQIEMMKLIGDGTLYIPPISKSPLFLPSGDEEDEEDEEYDENADANDGDGDDAQNDDDDDDDDDEDVGDDADGDFEESAPVSSQTRPSTRRGARSTKATGKAKEAQADTEEKTPRKRRNLSEFKAFILGEHEMWKVKVSNIVVSISSSVNGDVVVRALHREERRLLR
jgi:hypothetical protein